jgi:hypothetical protein
MVKSLHPLDPNGKVPVMQTVVPQQASESFFSNKAGILSFSFPVGQRFSVEILDVCGRSVFSTTTSGKKFEIIGARFPAGVYVVRVAGKKTALQPRMVVLHP